MIVAAVSDGADSSVILGGTTAGRYTVKPKSHPSEPTKSITAAPVISTVKEVIFSS